VSDPVIDPAEASELFWAQYMELQVQRCAGCRRVFAGPDREASEIPQPDECIQPTKLDPERCPVIILRTTLTRLQELDAEAKAKTKVPRMRRQPWLTCVCGAKFRRQSIAGHKRRCAVYREAKAVAQGPTQSDAEVFLAPPPDSSTGDE